MESIKINSKEVLNFLKEIKDNNYIHREGYQILPGMFGLSLIEEQTKRPILSLDIEFNKSVKYPCELKVELEESEDKSDFRISNEEGIIYSGLVTFDDEDDLELNPFKFFSTYRVGGELLRHSESYFKDGETGIYLSQGMEFHKGENPLNGNLDFGDISGDRKKKIIPLEYRLGEKILAKGTSRVRPITKKLLERRLLK